MVTLSLGANNLSLSCSRFSFNEILLQSEVFSTVFMSSKFLYLRQNVLYLGNIDMDQKNVFTSNKRIPDRQRILFNIGQIQFQTSEKTIFPVY